MACTEEYMTVVGVANHFRVCEDTIYKLLRTGDLKGIKIGGQWRIAKSVIEQYATYPCNTANE
tara:strand:+ start:1232 stop:1420 length:189 start_codon:yes stop_codon:yes gene_type:complete